MLIYREGGRDGWMEGGDGEQSGLAASHPCLLFCHPPPSRSATHRPPPESPLNLNMHDSRTCHILACLFSPNLNWCILPLPVLCVQADSQLIPIMKQTSLIEFTQLFQHYQPRGSQNPRNSSIFSLVFHKTRPKMPAFSAWWHTKFLEIPACSAWWSQLS